VQLFLNFQPQCFQRPKYQKIAEERIERIVRKYYGEMRVESLGKTSFGNCTAKARREKGTF
jgi:hypothetical protein